MTVTNLRRRKEDAYGVVNNADPNQYAFGTDVGSTALEAWLYADGVAVSLRAAEATLADGIVVGCILDDSSALVGDGSAIMADFKIWDVVGAVVHTYGALEAGWITRGTPYYRAGFLWWIETTDILTESPEGSPPYSGTPSFDLRLMKSATDWTGLTVIETITITATDYGSPWNHFIEATTAPVMLAVDTNGAVLYASFRLWEPNHENAEWTNEQYRFAIAGGAPGVRTSGAGVESDLTNGSMASTPFPTATKGGTSFVFATADGTDITLCAKLDDATNVATALWSVIAEATLLSMNVGLDGNTAQIYCATDPDRFLYRGISSGTLMASTIDPFDDVKLPESMYFFGGA